MLALLPIAKLDPVLFADWVELCAAALGRTIDHSDVEDVLHDNNLLPPEPVRGDEYSEEEDPDVRRSRFVGDIWRQFHRRKQECGEGYPFEVGATTLELREARSGHIEYLSMLLADVSQHYKQAKLRKHDPFRLLFEKITASMLPQLVGGKGVVLGTSVKAEDNEDNDDDEEPAPEPGGEETNHLAIVAKIRAMCDAFSIRFVSLDGEIDGDAKDASLDVAVKIGFGDERPGGLYLLVQCATSVKWHKLKKGEPSLETWRTLVRWDGRVMRAIAVPYSVDDEMKLKLHGRACDGVVLDRRRLSRGAAKSRLSPEDRVALEQWFTTQKAKIPLSA